MRAQAEILSQIVKWGRASDIVRAAVLTSSRVHPDRTIDVLSDYDVELYVRDLGPFRADDDWLASFGVILVCWPLRPRETGFRDGWITRLVLFEDRVRIDFQITDRLAIPSDAYRNGCRVLLDKDGLTGGIDAPTHDAHWIRRPTLEQYRDRVNAFWWDAPYVAKHLWRDELPFAAHMLSSLRAGSLRTMIEWSIGAAHDWRVDTGLGGRWFKRFLDSDTWSAYEETFATAEIRDHWRAFDATTALFGRTARLVGKALGVPYPEDLERRMLGHLTWIRGLERTLP